MKLGVLLGSFDPPHMGHLHMANTILNKEFVDKIMFVPTVQNPWKEKSTDFKTRCFMIQMALNDMDNCYLSTVESRISEPYYSYKTLELLQQEYPNDELYLIVGSDLDIKNWNNGQWIIDNFKIITIARNVLTGSEDISEIWNVSSTEIRELVKKNKQLYPLVPKVISQYIKQFNLYK